MNTSTFRGSHWAIGIDAGATSTKGVVVNLKGEELASEETSPFNLRWQKINEFEAIVFNLIHNLVNLAHLGGHSPGAIGVGVAGAGREQDRTMLHDALAQRFPQSRIYLHHDAWIAHYGAFSGHSGVLVTAGTGSIAFGRNDVGEEARSGGWGWLLGDEGSGWWIGREAVRAALAEWESSGPATKISQLLLDTFELENVYDVISKVYRDKITRRDLTLLAEDVGGLAKSGDAVARDIYLRCGNELGRLAVNTARKLEIAPRSLKVSMLGSIATGDWDLLAPSVQEVLDEYRDQSGEEEKSSGKPGAASAKQDVDGSAGAALPKMPQFPPKDLTLSTESGPHLIKPEMSAVRGAAQWAVDQINAQMFA